MPLAEDEAGLESPSIVATGSISSWRDCSTPRAWTAEEAIPIGCGEWEAYDLRRRWMLNRSLELEKSKQVCRLLDELGMDCWLIWVRETDQIVDPSLQFVYDGAFVWQTALLYTRSGERILIAGALDAIGMPEGLFDRIEVYDEGVSATLRRVLSGIDPASIAINISESDVASDGMTVGMHNLLEKYLAGTPYAGRMVSSEELILRLRGRKLDPEVERIREAIRITEGIFNEQIERLAVGQSEMSIHARFHEAMDDCGVGDAWAADHNPAVDAGPGKEFGHGRPADHLTKAGHLLHFDFGIKKDGYCSDLQRMIFFGARADIPDEIQHAFDAVLGAIDAAAAALRPGRLGHEIDTVARQFVIDRGYSEYLHALGHQVGRNAHDGGVILGPRWEKYGASVDGPVEAGNVFTLELDVRTDNYGQVSLEEDVLVTEDRCVFLSTQQREIICVET